MDLPAGKPLNFRYLGFFPILVGSVTLFGHIFGIDILTRLHPAFFRMRASVSLSLILIGLALLPERPRWAPQRLLVLGALAIATLSLILRWFLWAGALDSLGGVPWWLAWLEMSSLTAVSLLCCSASILLTHGNSVPDRTAAALLLACLSVLVCGASVMGDIVPLPRVGSVFGARMAIHTALTLALTSIGLAWSIWRTRIRDATRALRLAIAVLAAGVVVCIVGWRAVLSNRAAFATAEATSRTTSVAHLFNQHVQGQTERLHAFADLARRAALDLKHLAASGFTVLETNRSSAPGPLACAGSAAPANLIAQAQHSVRPVVAHLDCGANGLLILWGAFVRPGTILLAQQPFRSILEKAIAPFTGQSWWFVFSPRHGEPVTLRAGNQRFAESARVDTEVNLGGLDGTLRMYMDPAFVRGGLAWIAELGMICGLAGAFTLALGVYLGLAAQLRYRSMVAAQHALSRQAQQLLASNANLQQFAYVASHDLQEPLRTTITYSQLLQRRFGDKLGPEGERFLAFLENASQRMSALIRDLLAYSSVVNAGEPPAASVDMNLVVRLALDNLSIAVQESGARVHYEALPHVTGYQVQLVQLMQNLISNALKYRAAGPPHIEIGAERTRDSWVFRVHDNGIGIKPEYHERIFGIFRRLHGSSVPGTGIGLALCKAILEQHGGAIWVESELGTGSTFCFRLPATDGRPQS